MDHSFDCQYPFSTRSMTELTKSAPRVCWFQSIDQWLLQYGDRGQYDREDLWNLETKNLQGQIASAPGHAVQLRASTESRIRTYVLQKRPDFSWVQMPSKCSLGIAKSRRADPRARVGRGIYSGSPGLVGSLNALVTAREDSQERRVHKSMIGSSNLPPATKQKPRENGVIEQHAIS